LEGIIDKIPKEVGELKDLVFLSLPNNPNLTELPKEIANLPNLQIVNLKQSPNVKVPDEIENKEGLHVFR
jgi:Leucine-rich repeat (LRR) protein